MLDRTLKFLSITSVAFSLSFLWCLPVNASLAPAGQVILADGPFIAIQTNASARSLSHGSEFYQGDRLWTGPRTRAQIQFSDGAIMTLRPDTEFSVDEYQFDEKNADNNTSFFTLIKGGFRTLTGLISKLRPDGYKVKTAYAIVGVRGTTYELVDQSALYVAAWEGTISVTNNKSEMLLGFGQDFNYAKVTSVNSAPTGTIEVPPPLQQAPDPGLQQAMVDPTVVRLVTAVDNPVASITPPPPPRLSSAEVTSLDRLGFAASTFENASGQPVVTLTGSPVISPMGGLANDLAGGGNPIIFDQGQDIVLRQGGAPASSVITDNATFPGFTVSWGQWDAAPPNAPAIVQNDALNGLSTQDVANTVFWTAVTPTPTAALPVNATYNFTSTLGQISSLGAGSGGGGSLVDTVQSFSASFDFASGVVTGGTMVVVDGSNNWNTVFDGGGNSTISGASFNIKLNETASFVNSANAQGTISGAVTGAAAQGVAGVFDLQEVGNSNTNVQGTFFAHP